MSRFEPLSQVRMGESNTVVQRIVDAITAKVLKPWTRHKEIQKAIEEGRDSLPYQLKGLSWSPTESELRAREAAAAAIAKLRPEAPYAEMQATAINAVQQIVAQFEHQQACDAMVNGVGRHLPGATTAELELAKEGLALALGQLPGIATRVMEEVRDRVLVPLKEVIGKRQQEQAAERRQREDQQARKEVADARWKLPWGWSSEVCEKALAGIREAIDALPADTPLAELEQARDKIIGRYKRDLGRQEKIARLIDGGLREIRPYLVVLQNKWEFDKSTAALEAELRQPVRTALEKQLSGSETPEEVGRLMRRAVREELDIPSRKP